MINNDRNEWRNGIKVNITKIPRKVIKGAKTLKKRMTKKFGKKISAIFMATTLALSGCSGCVGNNKTDEIPDSSPSYSVSTYSIQDSMNKAQNDFLKRYIEAYNKIYGTSYQLNKLEIINNPLLGNVFRLQDGTKVTQGSNSVETEEILEEKIVDTISMNSVVQILSNEEEGYKVLGTYDCYTLEAMLSGNDFEGIKEYLEGKELPEFENLKIDNSIVKAIFELCRANGCEDKKSLGIRIDRYNEAIKGIEEEKESKSH